MLTGRRFAGAYRKFGRASITNVLTLLSRLNKESSKTIIMVTHDPRSASFALKIRHLDKGELLPESQISSHSMYSAAR